MNPGQQAFLDQLMAEVRETAYTTTMEAFDINDVSIQDMTEDQKKAFDAGVNTGVLAVLITLSKRGMIVPPGDGMIFDD